jgi:hypothetical protein
MTPGEDYAASVVRVLLDYFPDDLTDPGVTALIEAAVNRQVRDPRDSFEFTVDDPWSSRWRLQARSDDRTRVRLAYYPVIPPGSDAGNALEHTVNDALRALEAGQ